MKVILGPGLLPESGNIQVASHDDTKDHLLNLLRALKPKADFQVFDGGKADFVVTTEPGREIEHAYLLPLPIGDPWGWWEWSKRAVESPEGLAEALTKRLPLPPSAEGQVYGADRHFMRQHFKNIPAHLVKRIEQIAFGLADEESRKSYAAVLFGTPEGLAERYHARLFNGLQYTDWVRLGNDAVVLNGGVHDGSEIPVFLAQTNGTARLHNIDPGGYDYLSPYAQRWLDMAENRANKGVFALSNSLGRKEMAICDDGQINPRFKKGDGTGINLNIFPSMTLEDYVQSRRLDRIDLIKLDLEGDEEIVVPTLPDLVDKFRPQLAISIYHKATHFWSIPEFLMDRLEDYRFHMGQYSSQSYETILYAIPEELS